MSDEQTSTFHDLDLPTWLVERIAEIGYETPTPVQAAAIPAVRSGVDVVAQAQTGTGKTAAFAIPILAELQAKDGPVQAVILAPTRELARQVSDEFVSLSEGQELETFAVYGGVSMDPQIQAFKRAHILVCTPGRLLDHLRRGNINFQNLRIFGLDEADEMLSMGFEREITEILGLLPEKRQNILFSATMPRSVMRFADNFLKDATKLNLSSDQVGAASVRHVAYRIGSDTRLAALRSLLRAHVVHGAIIFANTKVETFRIHNLLVSEGYSAGVLNGDLAQKDREKILKQLQAESLDFLVATDIAARGIDISWLRAVINYEMPNTAENYIHRTGRTGRAGTVGTAYSLITPGDISVYHALRKLFDIRFETGTLPNRDDIRSRLADEQIETLLDTLDSNEALEYGPYLALAKRLAERQSGTREVAKLLAYYTNSGPSDTPAQQPSSRAQESNANRQDTHSSSQASAHSPAEEIVNWIENNSHSKPPIRSAHAISKALDLTEEDINRIAKHDGRLEQLDGRNVRWKVVESSDEPRSNKTADADRQAASQARIHKIVNTATQPSAPTSDKHALPASWISLQVNVGSEHFGSDAALANWFAEYAGFDHGDTRRVQRQKTTATVEVNEDYWRDFIEALHHQSWNGHRLNVHRTR